MPHRLSGVFMLLLVAVTMVRAQGDVALFVVGSDTVRRSAFESYLNRFAEGHPEVSFQRYVRFKQQVLYAKELGLDTLSAHIRQKNYLQQVWREKRQLIDRDAVSPFSTKEWIKLVHVSCPLSQHASKAEEQKGQRYLDSLYVAWKCGKWDLSQAEELPWMQTRYLLKEWQMQLQGLPECALTPPFYSPVGVHVIAWMKKVSGHAVEAISTPNQMDFGVEEVEEGLLMAALECYWTEHLRCTPQELETYFRQHRDGYGWGIPHYRGAVIHCQDKKEAKRIRKYLKKYPLELWEDAWKRMPTDVSSCSSLEIGLFPIGTNAFVDKLVFKCGAPEPLPEYPFTAVLGKKLKKGPESYLDVRGKLEKDCLKAKKEAEIEALKLKYKVEINEEVLKTVNHAGNK